MDLASTAVMERECMTYDNLEALQGLRPAARFVQIGTVVVDLATHAVKREDELLRLTPKAAEVLKVLLRHEGEPVGRELLIEQVWRGQCPTDDVVTKAIGELRRVLVQGDTPIIETIPRVGYRLLPVLKWLDQQTGLSWLEQAELTTGGDAATVNPAAPTSRLRRLSGIRTLLVVLTLLALVLIGVRLVGRDASVVSSVNDDHEAAAALRQQLALAMAGHLSVAVRPFAAGALSEYLPSISPDGQLVVFGEWPAPEGVGSRLMIRAVGAESARPLIPEQGVRSETAPKWSPDGQTLIYQRIDENGCQLRWFAPFSGDHREVTSCDTGFIDWIDFTPDGSGLLLSRPVRAGEAPRLRILDLASGQWRDLDYQRQAQDADVQGVYSPDGRWLVFRRGAVPISDLYLMPADGGPVRRLTELRSTMRGVDWMPDSRHLIYGSSHGGQMGLWLLDSLTGQSSPLGAYGAAFPQVAAQAGVLVYQQQLQPHNLVRIELEEDRASLQPLFLSARADGYPSLSPDGRQLAFVSNRAGRNEIMLGDLTSNDVVSLTRTRDGDVGGPAWSPDGRSLLYTQALSGGARLIELEVASRRIQTIELDVLDPRNGRYSSDGRSLYFDAEVEGLRQIFRADRSGGQVEQLTVDGGMRPIPSPDGRQLYFLGMGFNLQRIDLPSGRPVALHGAIGFGSQFAWEVDERGVHALRSTSTGSNGWGLQIWPSGTDPASPPEQRAIRIEGELAASLLGLSIGPDGAYYTTAELNTDVDVMYVGGLDRLLPSEAVD